MKNIWTIARRELKSYFDSPVAYIVIVLFLLIAGWLCFRPLFLLGRAEMRLFFMSYVPGYFSPPMLLVLFVPGVTMRLIAEERKNGTIELLTTLPIRDWEIVIGKFVAAQLLFSIAIGATVVYPITIAAIGDLAWGPVIGGYVGLWFFVAGLVGIGMLASSVTEDQIVALILAVVGGGFLYGLGVLRFITSGVIVDITDIVGLGIHLDNLARGVLEARDVLYYLTLITGTLFLSVRAVEAQHA